MPPRQERISIRGDRIRALREKMGLRQYQLAADAKTSQGWLSAIERGESRVVGSDILERLARRLQTNVEYLLGTSADPRQIAARIRQEDVTPDEQAILAAFRALPPWGRQHALFVVRHLAETAPAYPVDEPDQSSEAEAPVGPQDRYANSITRTPKTKEPRPDRGESV